MTETVSTRSPVVMEGRFDPKLRTYLFLQGLGLMVVTVVGIPLIPVWLLLGGWWARRYYDNYHCLLTERSLVVKRGILFRQETTLPLDKVQDLSIRHGPLLDALGLASLSIETAGASSSTQAPSQLKGLVDVAGFRDRVLDQRDRLMDRLSGHNPGGEAPPELEEGDADDVVRLLREIRDSLRRLEGRGDADPRERG